MAYLPGTRGGPHTNKPTARKHRITHATALMRRLTFDLDKYSSHDESTSYRARSVNIHNALEGIIAIRSLGGERLPAASYDLRLNLQKVLFLAIGEESRFFFVCFQHISCQMHFYQTPGGFPPHTIHREGSTVTLGWVVASNQRDPFKIHDAVAGFVDRCPT